MAERPVVIIGGGVIGLATGWTLVREGVPVTLFDRDRVGRGTSWLAAGMLAPRVFGPGGIHVSGDHR